MEVSPPFSVRCHLGLGGPLVTLSCPVAAGRLSERVEVSLPFSIRRRLGLGGPW